MTADLLATPGVATGARANDLLEPSRSPVREGLITPSMTTLFMTRYRYQRPRAALCRVRRRAHHQECLLGWGPFAPAAAAWLSSAALLPLPGKPSSSTPMPNIAPVTGSLLRFDCRRIEDSYKSSAS